MTSTLWQTAAQTACLAEGERYLTMFGGVCKDAEVRMLIEGEVVCTVDHATGPFTYQMLITAKGERLEMEYRATSSTVTAYLTDVTIVAIPMKGLEDFPP